MLLRGWRAQELKNPASQLADAHPSGMSRLVGHNSGGGARPFHRAEIGSDWNAHVILKGQYTIVAAPVAWRL